MASRSLSYADVLKFRSLALNGRADPPENPSAPTPAPHLPAETIDRILDFVPASAYPITALLGEEWKQESQRRIYTEIRIHSNAQLTELVEGIQIQSYLSNLVYSLHLYSGEVDVYGNREESLQGKTVIKLFLALSNLSSLTFRNVEFYLTVAQVETLRSHPLSKLNFFHLHTNGPGNDIDRGFLRSILGKATPNLSKLKITGEDDEEYLDDDEVIRVDDWRLEDYPKRSISLEVDEYTRVTQGAMVPLKIFEGKLSNFRTWSRQLSASDLPFLELISPSVKSFKSAWISAEIISPYLPYLSNLETLEISIIDQMEDSKFFLFLPCGLKKLTITWGIHIESALQVYAKEGGGFLKLEELVIRKFSPIDFLPFHLVPASILRLEYAAATILPSLEALTGPGQVSFRKLIVVVEDKGIRKRCDELGIELEVVESDS